MVPSPYGSKDSYGSQDYGSANSANRAPSEPTEAEATPERELLEQVLQNTLSAAGDGASLDDAQMIALVDVARRHRGQPLSLDPVVVDLVRAILKVNFHRLRASDAVWQAMSQQIAETLWEDHLSHERLERFWVRLGEAAR